MNIPVACMDCGAMYPQKGTPYCCPECGGIFDWIGLFPCPANHSKLGHASLWQYEDSFCLPEVVKPISLGEGNTPLIEDVHEGRLIYYKLESLNPTGSYKDRASTVLVSFLRSRGVISAVEDSSGNAGASLAAYAARAGMHAKVFVPESASGPKQRQIEIYGAELVNIEGPREASMEAVRREVKAGAVYASHAFMPFGLAGIATIAYELVQQLGKAPGTVIIPAGHASLALGILRGFKSLILGGVIDQCPVYVVVQSRACAPIWAAYNHKSKPAKESATLAEGVKVLNPIRAVALLKELNRSCDRIMAFDDKQIIAGRMELALRGIDVEPTSALVWCVLVNSTMKLPEPIVLILTGSGLKYGSIK